MFLISFNVGPVHVISISTEFYYYIQYGYEQILNQFKWVEEDLKVLLGIKKRKRNHFSIDLESKFT